MKKTDLEVVADAYRAAQFFRDHYGSSPEYVRLSGEIVKVLRDRARASDIGAHAAGFFASAAHALENL
ncbi:hypothetical protein [Paraburkholderia sp. DGU8]|jgi:hypothetical protein|uniref:hypothetical protein n=1 Tax=Paraburkholderia sp. DGU8 TaxID=3161997 RepID=UPI003466A083